jgi:hypothetical protein
MKLPYGPRAHEGARPVWRPRLVWLWILAFRRRYQRYDTKLWMRDLMEGVAYLPK